VPSLALGSSEVTLLELVRAYGVLAAGGDLAESRPILARGRYDVPIAYVATPRVARVADPAVAYLVTSTLQGAVARGTGRALNRDWRYEGIAGKTGTSNGWRDAWFIAYSPALVVGAWVGFDDGRSLGTTGAGAALPIVARFLEDALSEARWDSFEVPDGITERPVTLAHGGWSWECGQREFFLEGTEPAGSDCYELSWRGVREWGGEVPRGVGRLLDDLGRWLGIRRSRPQP
jgi:penicillin-binding protein 1B